VGQKERHVVRRINFMHDYFMQEQSNSKFVWCSTEDMVADALTKDLHGSVFQRHRQSLTGSDV